jgi:putative ABC transport system ATP-binding protein
VGSVSWPGLGVERRAWPPGTVGVVFQGESLLPALDATENVALPLLLRGVDDDEATARAVAALEQLGLGAVARLLPEELSAGQSQRVAVARALAPEPRLIVADEPTGRLDGPTGASVVTALERAADASGAAVVIATHDRAVASRFAVRWVMSEGTIDHREPAWAG